MLTCVDQSTFTKKLVKLDKLKFNQKKFVQGESSEPTFVFLQLHVHYAVNRPYCENKL